MANIIHRATVDGRGCPKRLCQQRCHSHYHSQNSPLKVAEGAFSSAMGAPIFSAAFIGAIIATELNSSGLFTRPNSERSGYEFFSFRRTWNILKTFHAPHQDCRHAGFSVA